jgi:hypothetical protein
LTVSHPDKAVERLQKIQAFLDDDTTLPPSKRSALKRMLKDCIRVARVDPGAKDNQKKPATISARRAEQDRVAAESEQRRISKALEAIRNLQGEGKTGQASREAGELANQQPHNNSVQAAERSAQALDQAASARRLQKEREKNLIGAYRDIDKSSTPAGGDIEFPKDWKERTKNRSTALKLSEREKEILRALNSRVAVNFKNSKFEDVLEYMRTRLNVDILIDPEALKDAEISYDSLVTLNIRQVPARTVLRKLFGDLNMTYVIKDESIYVVSAQKAREMMVVRSYYIGDLLAGMGGLGTLSPLQTAPLPLAAQAPVNQQQQLQAGAQMLQTANAIIDMIKTNVDPQTWQDNGGAGTIKFHAASMSILIKQSAEVHAQLSSGGLAK